MIDANEHCENCIEPTKKVEVISGHLTPAKLVNVGLLAGTIKVYDESES